MKISVQDFMTVIFLSICIGTGLGMSWRYLQTDKPMKLQIRVLEADKKQVVEQLGQAYGRITVLERKLKENGIPIPKPMITVKGK